MKQATTGILVVILLVGLGFVIASVLDFSFLWMHIPSEHNAIVDSMEIIDTKANYRLEPKLVDSGTRQWAKGIPLATFESGESYPQTTWIWQRYGDTEFVMTIWGPDDTGKTYLIELGKTACSPFKVVVNGETKLVITEISAWSTMAEGFYRFIVEVD